MPRDEQPEPLKVIEERLDVGKRAVERGRVAVRIRVEEREDVAQATLHQEEVTVERVVVDRPIDAVPAVREEDGVLIVPIVEERLVVVTQLVLKEELHIIRTSRSEQVSRPVRLRSEQVEITRSHGPTPDQPNPQEGSSI